LGDICKAVNFTVTSAKNNENKTPSSKTTKKTSEPSLESMVCSLSNAELLEFFIKDSDMAAQDMASIFTTNDLTRKVIFRVQMADLVNKDGSKLTPGKKKKQQWSLLLMLLQNLKDKK